jgi:predicted TIM-barrel fold metal-dependent hydrolase
MAQALPIVDAHHHFWDIERNYHPWLCDEPMIPFRYGDYSSIRKPFMPEDYFSVSRDFNVIGNVTVEGEWDPRDPIGETRWIHEIAEEYGKPNAHVAQIWLDDDKAPETTADQAAFPLVRSVRHKPHATKRPSHGSKPEPGGMSDPAYMRGYAVLSQYDLSFDLQTPWWHLTEALALAEKYPEIPIILNHTGLPSDRSPEGLDEWREAMRVLAEFPGASVKISGLGLPGVPWRVDDNRPIILDTIDIFGIDRCMFASNFPVDSVVADFNTIFNGYFESVKDFGEADKRKLFAENAIRIYRIKV